MKATVGEIGGRTLIMPCSFFFADPNSVNAQVINNDVILLQNFPNPCKDFTKISFRSIPGEMVEISLYNLNGEKMKEIWKGETTTSLKEVMFNTEVLESGIYFIQMNSGNRTVVKKMVLSR